MRAIGRGFVLGFTAVFFAIGGYAASDRHMRDALKPGGFHHIDRAGNVGPMELLARGPNRRPDRRYG